MYYSYYRETAADVSKRILSELYNLGGLILTVEKDIETLLVNSQTNKNPDFLRFINHFRSAAYFHLQGQGFLNALIQTNNFTKETLCYCLNNYVYPADTHFTQAFKHFKTSETELSKLNNADYNRLVNIVNELERVVSQITGDIKAFNITC